MLEHKEYFWSGFVIGAASGAVLGLGGVAAWRRFCSVRNADVVRVNASIQIARPVQEVFRPCLGMEDLPRFSPIIRGVTRQGRRSEWHTRYEGNQARWEMEITQVKPDEALAWKSLRGPKHTGRLSFAPFSDETILGITLNYAPPVGMLGGAFAPAAGCLQRAIEQALRDFKAAVEEGTALEYFARRGTGTFAEGRRSAGHMQHSRFGGAPATLEPPPATSQNVGDKKTPGE